jgi:hypothetical protein
MQKGQTNAGVVALFVPEGLPEEIGLARGTETCATLAGFFISGEPSGRGNEEYTIRLGGPLFAPFRPPFVRTAGVLIKIELIQFDGNPGITQPLPKQPDGSRVLWALVTVTNEDVVHELVAAVLQRGQVFHTRHVREGFGVFAKFFLQGGKFGSESLGASGIIKGAGQRKLVPLCREGTNNLVQDNDRDLGELVAAVVRLQ